MRRLAVAASLLLAPLAAHAQGIPPNPAPTFGDFFERVTSQYRFHGCALGIVAEPRDLPTIYGRLFCVNGLVSFGPRTEPSDGARFLGVWYDYATEANPLGGGVTPSLGDSQLFNGLLVTPACLLGCPASLNAADAEGIIGDPDHPPAYSNRSLMSDLDPDGRFLAKTGTVSVFYTAGGDGALGGSVFLDVTLSAVPEPATWALLGAGLVALRAVARRRRRA